MKIIGVTGPSGAGKSMLCGILAKNGISVIYADVVYHGLLVPPSQCLEALRSAFGNGVLCEDGSLNRKALATIVFNDEEKLKLLNSTVHGFVLDKIRELISELQTKHALTVAVDAPTLIESGFHKECDIIISVLCTPEVRISRIIERDGITPESAKERTKAQKPDEFYIEHSDHVIVNNGNETDFLKEIYTLIEKL